MSIKTHCITRVFSLLLCASMVLACSKDEGQDGATGPIGPQGEQGLEGPEGERGETGTANVIYSGWITSEFEANILTVRNGFDVDAPDLTEDIINNGVVLGFAKDIPALGIPSIYQLPKIAFQNEYSVILQSPGSLRFSVASLDNVAVGTTRYEAYRYVLIPGGNPTSGKSGTMDYSKMTYKEVAAHFNIPN